ncbi:hypothetical protein cje4_08415, partial [Campylobacter jejuni subsp. jejuni 140-16]
LFKLQLHKKANVVCSSRVVCKMITLSSFNRYFGNNPLQTLTKIRDESIENAKI